MSAEPEPQRNSSGNPVIAKGEGDGPVQAYIAAMPDWKRGVGETIDAIVAELVPGVHKKVKWNTPFFGVDDETSFLAMYCYRRYVQLTFFRGESLDPPPPKASSQPEVRYLDLHEDDEVDTPRLRDWIRQAADLPGEAV